MNKLSVIIYFLFSTAAIILAQNEGGIKGKIIDSKTNAPLPGANILIMETSLGTSTDNEGYFNLLNVPEGLYQIRVSYIGYNHFIKPDVRVVRKKTTHVEEIRLSESVIESEPITVTAGIFMDVHDIPVSTYNFTKDEIRRAPGAAGDIFRALGTLPGVATEGGELSGFSVRGGGPRDNIILVDNIPFTKLSHFDEGGLEGESAGGGRFSIFTTSLIDNATFHAGGFPARYGGKNASIINLNVKEGNINDWTIYGHYDLFGWEANYDGPIPINDKSGLIVSVRQIDFSTIFKLIDEEGHGNPKYTDLIIKTTTELNSSNKISLLGIYADDFYTRTVENIFQSDNLNSNVLSNHKNYRYLLGGNWRLLFGDLGFLSSSVYYYYDYLKTIDGRVNTANDFGLTPNKDNAFFRENIYNDLRSDKTFGYKSDLTLSFSKNIDLYFGIEQKINHFDLDMRLNGMDTLFVFGKNDIRPSTQNFLIINPDDYNASTTLKNTYSATYAEASFDFGKLTVNPGLRFEHYSYNRDNYFSPRLSLRYQISPKVTINASTGIYYQMPELYLLSMDSFNSDLKNEKAYHIILGTSTYLTNDIKLTLETYYKKLEDAVVRQDRNDLKFTNGGDGWASGIDLSLVKRFADDFYGQLSYSYTISKRNDNDGGGEYDYAFSKPHMFNIMGGYQINEEWSVTAKWYITSGYPVDNYIINEDVLNNSEKLRYSKEVTEKNGHRLAANHSLNIRVDYRTQFDFFALNLYVDVLNVYGVKNVTREDFLEQSGLHHNETLQTVPTLGFRLEF